MISKFFPYESVHASDVFITISDYKYTMKDAIIRELKNYTIEKYHNCFEGYFNLEFGNKITLEFQLNLFVSAYLTWWDGMVYIGFNIVSGNLTGIRKYASIKRI